MQNGFHLALFQSQFEFWILFFCCAMILIHLAIADLHCYVSHQTNTSTLLALG